MAQQTAVEWLYNHLFPKQLDGFSEEEWDKIDKAFEQAKQMFEEQVKKAYSSWPLYKDINDNGDFKLLSAEQYYNETYGNNQNK